MATRGTRLDDPKYKNWIRDTLGLMYMKDSLGEFANDQSKLFHANLCSSVPPLPACAASCTSKHIKKDFHNRRWFMKCPSCNTWLQQVIANHTKAPFPKLSPGNTNPQLWQSVPWETIKLYMSFGCETHQSAEDVDVHGMLSMFQNCQFFLQQGNIGRQDLLEELIQIRNVLFHSGNFQVNDSDVQDHLKKMIEFLQGMTGLSGIQNSNIQQAILKIQELQVNPLDLYLDKDLEMRAIKQRQLEVARELRALQVTVEGLENELHRSSTETRTQIRSSIQTLQHDTAAEINTLKESIQKLKSAQDTCDGFLQQNEQTKSGTDPQAECGPTSLGVKGAIHGHQSVETETKWPRSLFSRFVNTFRPDRRGSLRIAEQSRKMSVSDLQTLLMRHYKSTCLAVQNPFGNDDVGLEYIYVEPTIKVLQQSKGRDGLKIVNEDASSMSCRKIFYTDNYQCRQIYITGDAGSGKSVLCKNLVQLWCEAHGCSFENEGEESATDSEEECLWKERRQARRKRQNDRKSRRKKDRKILSQFVFLFYIILRDSQSEYKVNEMIQSQILKHYEQAKGLNVLMALRGKRCLFLIDGIDEWVCPQSTDTSSVVNPGIPGSRDLSDENNVFLTTSRPWKFDVLHLKSSEVDKHIELCLFDDQSAVNLCSKTIRLLNKRHGDRKKKNNFLRTLNSEGLDHFKTVPVVLLQLIRLWFDNQELGKTQVQLYCAMIDLLLKKAQKNMTDECISTSKRVSIETTLPECIMANQYCRKNKHVLYMLSHLAFNALFDNTKENSLVFKSSEVEIFRLGQYCIDMCLQSGILSQNKVLEKCSVSEKKMSFLHKTFQEFLAAVFIASYDMVQDVVTRITTYCSALATCLEMSQVWLFIAGLNPDIAKQLLTHLTAVVAADEQVLQYRQSIGGEELIRTIQTCLNDCKTEGTRSGYINQDIFLENVYITETTFYHVESLLEYTPRSTVKSVHIYTKGIGVDQVRTITSWLQQWNSVQKLHLVDHWPYIPSGIVADIVGNNCDTLTCLDLYMVTATDELVTAICRSGSRCLNALRLRCVEISHYNKRQMLDSLSKTSNMKELELWLRCTDHSYKCKDMIDLSAMTQIQRLELWYLNVDNLESVAHSVEKVELLHSTLPMESLQEFAHILSQVEHSVDVNLYQLAITDIGDKDMKDFLRDDCEFNVTRCQNSVMKNTWRIDFSTSS